MNMATKTDIFKRYLTEYLKASKQRKGEIIKHVSDVIGMHQKSIIRRFRVLQKKHPLDTEARGRPVYYTPDVTAALKELWGLSGELCGDNLAGLLPEYVRSLIRDRQWTYGDETTGKLLSMSTGTVKERVRHFERSLLAFGNGKSTTVPSVMRQIPIRTDGWDTALVGTLQLDTVAHCGHQNKGDFIYTVNATDVTTLWGERRAQWNKGMTSTVTSMEAMEASLPIPLVEWHPDSGSEFMNQECWSRYQGKLTRSRPYHKNDNCFVEERNGHIVRKWLGFDRFDIPSLVLLLNDFYDVLTVFNNHFVSNRRIISKQRLGARWKVTREPVAKTPYERMMERADVSPENKNELQVIHESLNLHHLRTEIDRRRKKVFDELYRHGNKS
jgi:hypothetical protein